MNYTFSPFLTDPASETRSYEPCDCPCRSCSHVWITPVPKEDDVACDQCHAMFTPTPEAYVDNTLSFHQIGRSDDDGEGWKGERPQISPAIRFFMAGLLGLTMDEADELASKGKVTCYACLCPKCRTK